MKSDRRPVGARKKGAVAAGNGIGPLRLSDAISLTLLVLASAGAVWLVFTPSGMDWLAGLTPPERQSLGVLCVIVGVLGARTCRRLLKEMD
ncbi:hypothetical protein [Cupriavidus sp. IDO]|uniref:hypothetical protein n=1 Tax=Cupriavidus sp. IDO TaxID=1539142 RepID=UPI00126A2EB9|nr:hypothetical protein [Cupriavidus sp. IDO]